MAKRCLGFGSIPFIFRSSHLSLTRPFSNANPRFLSTTTAHQQSTLLENELKNRYLIEQITDENLFGVLPSSARVYCGFDPTADSLHIGNLLTIIALLHFQAHGYQPIALIGGATGSIGDPSGRKTERSPLEKEKLKNNVESIKVQVKKIFEHAEPLMKKHSPSLKNFKPLILKNNLDFYQDTNIISFFSGVGRYFRVSNMLAKESVKSRMESQDGISFSEFSYQIFQAFDFYHLFSQENCAVQIGGSDQWGNITAGIELIRRITSENSNGSPLKPLGLTLPLVTTSQGEKFGKSAGNAIWMDENKTSPYNLYQFFFQTPDSEVQKLLRFYTFLPLKEIEEILLQHNKEPEKRFAQKRLAEEVTLLLHQDEGLQKAQKVTQTFFMKEGLQDLSESDFQSFFKDAPKTFLQKDEVLGRNILEIVVKSKLCKSKNEARRLITGGGLYLNESRLEDSDLVISSNNLIRDSILILRVGKKSFHVVELKEN